MLRHRVFGIMLFIFLLIANGQTQSFCEDLQKEILHTYEEHFSESCYVVFNGLDSLRNAFDPLCADNDTYLVSFSKSKELREFSLDRTSPVRYLSVASEKRLQICDLTNIRETVIALEVSCKIRDKNCDSLPQLEYFDGVTAPFRTTPPFLKNCPALKVLKISIDILRKTDVMLLPDSLQYISLTLNKKVHRNTIAKEWFEFEDLSTVEIFCSKSVKLPPVTDAFTPSRKLECLRLPIDLGDETNYTLLSHLTNLKTLWVSSYTDNDFQSLKKYNWVERIFIEQNLNHIKDEAPENVSWRD
ncbi:MAG: hypothetical protein AAFZ63_06675 [Bacteroidota bacterium]